MTARYINLHFTYLLTYSKTRLSLCAMCQGITELQLWQSTIINAFTNKATLEYRWTYKNMICGYKILHDLWYKIITEQLQSANKCKHVFVHFTPVNDAEIKLKCQSDKWYSMLWHSCWRHIIEMSHAGCSTTNPAGCTMTADVHHQMEHATR